MKSVCVFCGSNPGNDPVYADAARARLTARWAPGSTGAANCWTVCTPAPGAPMKGQVMNGYKFKGGNAHQHFYR